jgi:hypothetical protein
MPNDAYAITLVADDVDHFRLMLREQMAGDHELMRNLLEGRESAQDVQTVAARLALVGRLAEDVGGLY